MDLLPVLAGGVVIFLTIVYYWIKNRGVVPGPAGVPYLGLYPYLSEENASLKLEEYKKQYGDIFSFTYTGRLFINLGSIKAMREVLLNKTDCFMEKFSDSNVLTEFLGNGIVLVNREPWKILRKYFIAKFKEYGLSAVRDNMAGPVYDSLNATIEDLKASNGIPVNIVELLDQRSAVTLRRIIFGEKGVTDENLGNMVILYTEALEGNFGINMLLIGPIARLLFAIKPSFRKNFNSYKRLRKLLLECVKNIESSMNEENPTCIIEEFYKERNKRRQENDSTWKIFSDEALVESVMQFAGDGIQAVAAFIAGIFNTLFEYPDEQEKLYSELMEVIGPNREPSAEDRPNLPYVNAFMSECIRYNGAIGFFPSLECTKETTIRGYRIPVGAITLYNFLSANRDPNTFDDPDTFNPSRYIATSDKPKAESPVIFGIGKRACSGEQFVMLQAFLFLTTIVKHFKIVASNAPKNNSADLLIAGKLELTFVQRAEN